VTRRLLPLAAPLVALAGIAMIAGPALLKVIVVLGFSYVAIVVLVTVRRRLPPLSSPLVRPAQPRASSEAEKTLLDKLESAIVLSRSGSAYERLLRPTLLHIATGRLRARGIDCEREPWRAEELLGSRVWQLVRPPDRVTDRDAPGASPAEIEEVLNAIEEV